MRRGHFHDGHWIHAIFMVAGAIALFGGGTMLLWNALIPTLFTLPTITFLQACGLVVLTRLLFGSHAHALMFLVGGHHGGGLHGALHERFHRRWNQMTPEEREHFHERFRSHGFGFGGRDRCCQHDRDRKQEQTTDEDQVRS